METKKAFESSAELYDALYEDKDYLSEVEFIENQFGRDKSLKILEIGCGTGNYLKIFNKKGYDITGVDISEEMLKVAKKKCDCKLVQGDLRDFKTGEKYDVILVMFDVLSYVTDNEGLVKTLQNIKSHLVRGGKLIFQVWNGLGVLSDKPEKRVKEIDRENFKIIRSVSPVLRANEHIVDVNYNYRIVNNDGQKIEDFDETHSMRFFLPQEIKYLLETNGFEVKTMSDFMDTEKPVDEKTWSLFCVAEKKSSLIPVCIPALLGREREYVLDAFDTNWISHEGKYAPLFEEAFSKYCGVRHGIITTNGTNALHLALVSLGIKEGDEIIIPDFTMISSAFSVCYTGAKPVFVDADKETWNIDVDKIEEKITPKTKAIMAVHIYGHPCEMDKILEIARKHNLRVIEDAAEVHGAEYNGKKCGSIGDIACFSFYANKIITTGEGGMVITNDEELAKKCRSYKDLCFNTDWPRKYLHEDIGFNYRASNLTAAIGLAQTEKIDDYVTIRRKNHQTYYDLLKDVEGLSFQIEKTNSKNVYWMNGVVIDRAKFGISRDELLEKLRKEKIGARPFFNGMHRQPALKKFGCEVSGDYPVSDWLADNGLYLPSGSNLREEEIVEVCEVIKSLSNTKN